RCSCSATAQVSSFQRCAAPRALHSFPTRRSSDLGGWAKFEAFDEVIKVRGGPDVAITVQATRHGPVISGFGRTTEGLTGPMSKPDRKSTRLNSSHDQISYAVFCSKKKKTPSRIRV